MYKLYFESNKSPKFKEALSFAKELGGSFDGKTVLITVSDEYLTEAYSTFRTIFGIIQKWKGTRATYNGEPVDPYRFILKMHKIKECSNESFENDGENCATDWACKKLTSVNQITHKFGLSWYNVGRFMGDTWVIDKDKIKKIIKGDANRSGAFLCPLFDETAILKRVDDLPDYIVPDGHFFEVTYFEKKVGKSIVLIKDNIRPVKRKKGVNRTLIEQLLSPQAPRSS